MDRFGEFSLTRTRTKRVTLWDREPQEADL